MHPSGAWVKLNVQLHYHVIIVYTHTMRTDITSLDRYTKIYVKAPYLFERGMLTIFCPKQRVIQA